MTPESQRIAIHEARGFMMARVKESLTLFKDRDGYPEAIFTLAQVPDYLNDLNATHEMEKVLTADQARTYHNQLGGMGIIWLWHATAAQRCEAFLRTIGKWTDA